MYSTNSFSNFPHITGTNFNLIQNSTNQIQGVGTVNQTPSQNILTPGGSHQLQQTNSIQTGLTNLQNSLSINGNIHGWPLFNPLINVPHFDLETYGSVNLDANCSQYKSGVDLPLHDITTLRFFYNFGVHQAKEILLKQQALKNTTPSNAQLMALVQQVHQQSTNNHQNDNSGTNLLPKQHNILTGIPQNIVINHNNHQNNSLPNNTNSLNILQGLQSQQNNISSISTPNLGTIINQQSKQTQNQITNHTQTTPFKINMLNNLQSEQSSNQLIYDNVLLQNVFNTNNNSNNTLQQSSTINEQIPTHNYSNMNSLSIALQAAKNGHPGAQNYIQELLKMRNETINTYSHSNLNENSEMSQYSNINSPNVPKSRGNYFSISSSPKGPIPVDPAPPPVCQSLNIMTKSIPTTSSNQTVIFENQNINLNNISSNGNNITNQFNNDIKQQITLSEKTQGVNKLFPQGKNLIQYTKDNTSFNNNIDQLLMVSKRKAEESIKNIKNNDIAFKSVLLNDDVLNVSGTSENHYIEYNTLLKNDDKVKNNNDILSNTLLIHSDQKKEFNEQQKLLNYDKLSNDENSSKTKKVTECNTESKNVSAALTPATALLAATEMHYTQTFTKGKNENNEPNSISNGISIQVSEIKNSIDQTKNENFKEISLIGSQQNFSKSSPQTSIISSSDNTTKINNTQNNIPENIIKSVDNSQKDQQYVEQPPLAPSLMINFLSCYFSQCKNQLQSHGTTLHLDDHGNPIDYSSRPIDPIFRNAKKETGTSIEILQPGSTSTMPELDGPIKESDLVSEAQKSVLVKNNQNLLEINREKIVELSVSNVTEIGEKRPYLNSVFPNPDEKKIKIIKNEDA